MEDHGRRPRGGWHGEGGQPGKEAGGARGGRTTAAARGWRVALPSRCRPPTLKIDYGQVRAAGRKGTRLARRPRPRQSPIPTGARVSQPAERVGNACGWVEGAPAGSLGRDGGWPPLVVVRRDIKTLNEGVTR